MLMRAWAGLVPQNFLHQLELVEAEQARCLGRDEQAAKSYKQAIHNARRNGYIHESALAAELAAEFYLAQKQTPLAIEYLCIAYYAYLAWGSAVKVTDLTSRYPDWLPPGKDKETHQMASADDENQAEELASSIDLSTILKASMELAHEISLKELLRKLMKILIEYVGAQNAQLVLMENDRWYLKVRGSSEPGQDFGFISAPMEYLLPQGGEPDLPISVIHYVINLKQTWSWRMPPPPGSSTGMPTFRAGGQNRFSAPPS